MLCGILRMHKHRDIAQLEIVVDYIRQVNHSLVPFVHGNRQRGIRVIGCVDGACEVWKFIDDIIDPGGIISL